MHVKIKKMPLKKLFNTRDLGGLPTIGGKKIVHGKLIRSGKLYNLPEKTVNALKALNVTTVADLRISTECKEYPDTLWEGVNYVNLPLVCTATAGITHEKTMHRLMVRESKRIKSEFGNADNYMIAMYRAILLNDDTRPQLKEMLRLVKENEGCLLWHCSGGKDRAGIVAMLVESLLGVDENVIIADFVASRRFQRRKYFWNRAGLVIAPCSLNLKRILYGMMAVKPEYISESMRELKDRYGSVVAYCKTELDVTDEDIELLKQKYLE